MPPQLKSAAGRMDGLVGDAIEAIVRSKHRLRLDRLGWSQALSPPDDGLWASRDPPPREGCELEVHIDGADAFAAIADAIEQARDYVFVTGWHIEPSFALRRDGKLTAIGELLAEAAERLEVRVLVWAGAPVPIFHPTRKEVTAAIENLTRGTRIRCQADPREHPFHCHHEKTVIVDGKTAFVGGIDISDYSGDRWDTPEHPARRRLGWHDVATRVRGPAVADVRDHFELRWRELTGERLEAGGAVPGGPDAVPGDGSTTVQVVRTIAEDMYESVPRGEFRIVESYVRAIRSARSYIYLENQFLWSPEIVALLADKLRHPPSDEFRLVVLLPAKANNGQDDTSGQLGVLVAADGENHRLLAATIRSRIGHRVDRLYVHAKVGIVDDRWLTVGSANLNAHSLFNDTEMNVVTDDADLARQTRLRLWSEHLEIEPALIADEAPNTVVDERWRPVATEQLERLRAGAPPTHRLTALPGISRRSGRLLGPLIGLLDDG